MTDRPTPMSAIPELLDLAVATRPDIDRDALQGAILAAGPVGWSWGRTMVAVAMMLAHGEEPRDLLEATRDPLKLRPGSRRRGTPYR